MQINLARVKGKTQDGIEGKTDLVWDSRYVVNGHMVIVGYPGTGKTTSLRFILKSLINTYSPSQKTPQKLRVHVIDVHDDIDLKSPDLTSELMFSASSPYGINPFVINSDVHAGGVLRAIQQFISIINSKGRTKLGERQQAALKILMSDLFYKFGFVARDPASWNLNPYILYSGQGENRRERGRWDKKQFPTLADMLDFAQNKMQNMIISGNLESNAALKDVISRSKIMHATTLKELREMERLIVQGERNAVSALDQLKKDTSKLNKVAAAHANEGGSNSNNSYAEALEKAKEKAIATYVQFIRSIRTGKELEAFARYSDPKLLQSLIDRLSNLKDTGIFQDGGMPFDPNKPIWRYRIKHIGDDYERRLFVMFRLLEIYREAMIRGEQDTICEVVVIDECKIFMDNNPDSILTKFVNELRKFGVIVILASQDMTHFPDGLLMGIATKIILGVSELSVTKTAKKLLIAPKSIEAIRPKSTALVNIAQSYPSDHPSAKYGSSLNGWLHAQLNVRP